MPKLSSFLVSARRCQAGSLVGSGSGGCGDGAPNHMPRPCTPPGKRGYTVTGPSRAGRELSGEARQVLTGKNLQSSGCGSALRDPGSGGRRRRLKGLTRPVMLCAVGTHVCSALTHKPYGLVWPAFYFRLKMLQSNIVQLVQE